MSYEGYIQCLCANGHHYIKDAYDDWGDEYISLVTGLPKEPYKCQVKDCDANEAWCNHVDQTNGPDEGAINMDQFRIKDSKWNTCPTCHRPELLEEALYRIPTEQETIAARTYHFNDEDE